MPTSASARAHFAQGQQEGDQRGAGPGIAWEFLQAVAQQFASHVELGRRQVVVALQVGERGLDKQGARVGGILFQHGIGKLIRHRQAAMGELLARGFDAL